MTDDGKTNTEKSGHPASNVWSTVPAETLALKFDAAIREEVTLFPIQVKSETDYAKLAKLLLLSSNVGIRRTYVSFNLPMGPKALAHHQERTNIMLRLKAICAPLNARYYVVSSRPKRLLTCVSYCKPTIALESTPLDGG